MELWILWIVVTMSTGQVLHHQGTKEFRTSKSCIEFGQPMADVLVTAFPDSDIELYCKRKNLQKV